MPSVRSSPASTATRNRNSNTPGHVVRVEQEDVMSKLRLAAAALVAIGTLTLAGSLNATPIAHTNYITFSAPVALPGVSLPAGTYLFETPLDQASLDVVRVKS